MIRRGSCRDTGSMGRVRSRVLQGRGRRLTGATAWSQAKRVFRHVIAHLQAPLNFRVPGAGKVRSQCVSACTRMGTTFAGIRLPILFIEKEDKMNPRKIA